MTPDHKIPEECETDITTPLLYGLIALCFICACMIWYTWGRQCVYREMQINCIDGREFYMTGYNGVYSCIRVW